MRPVASGTIPVDRRPRAAIADDARALRIVLRGHLERLGFAVVLEAADAPALLASLAACEPPPELLVVDGRLPPAGGVAAIRAVHAAYPALAAYVVAALGERDLVRAALAAGAAGAVQRPFVASLLESSLRRGV